LSALCILAQAEIAAKNNGAAAQELPLTLARAENLGLRVLQAKTEYLQGVLPGEERQRQRGCYPFTARRSAFLDSISKEEGSAKILERADLKSILQ